MKCRWPGLVSLVLFLVYTPAQGAEQHLEFLNGLRSKGYHEYALLYLTQIESDASVPEEVRQVLPLERALTLLENSRGQRNPDARKARLQQAEGLLDQFVRSNPGHPRAAEANDERARIHLEDARVANIEARSPSNEGKRDALRAQARQSIRKAREIFTTAHGQYESRWQQFPVHIPEDQRDLRAEREKVEAKYMRVQIDLALCTYEEAQTYDEGSPERSKLLTEASTQFEAIHSRYRSQNAGLYARMWQGKCFEEQGDLGKALGIYNELLGHPGDSPSLKSLQNQVRHFRLICWNHPTRNDHQLVVNDATEWLDARANRAAARTRVGVGIRYERARALEALAMPRTLAPNERDRMLRLALADAQQVAQSPYEYKDLALFMSQRLKAALGRGSQDPQDFDTAVGLARAIMKQIEDLDVEIAKENDAQKRTALEQDRKVQIEEAARLLQLGLRLSDARTEISQVNRARIQLAYMYYLAGQSRRAAVLGEFVGRRFPTEDPNIAQESAFVALVAWIQAYNNQPGEERDFEIDQIIRVGELITTSWPESDRAVEARMQLGRLFDRREMPVEAAAYYDQIPPSAASYADARIHAGQAYWNAYLRKSALPDDERPSQEELRNWQQAAEQHLQTGLEKKAIPTSQPAPDEYIAAKLTLAQVKINQGREADAIKLIKDEPHSVLKAIAVPEGQKRPARGVKSVDFASLTYQLLLRSYVGTQQIDEALAAMGELEKIVPAGQDESVTAIYVRLGQELAKEIERLRELGESERMAQVFSAFDQFLGELFNRRDNMGYGALRWIAETYYGLGESLDEGDPRQDEYFRKSGETYQIVIERAQRDPNFAPGTPLSGFKLRLADTRRRQGEFEAALNIVREVVKEQPKALDAQFAAAETLQDWGASGRAGAHPRLLEAINGRPDDQIWGWARTANTLQTIIHLGENDRYLPQYYQAVYNQALSRKQYAAAQSSSEPRKQALEAAKMELEAFARLTDVSKMGGEWWNRFDQLYRDVQRDMGVFSPVALEKPLELPPPAPPRPAARAAQARAGTRNARSDETTADAGAPGSGGTLWAVLAIVGALAAAGGLVFMMMSSQSKRRRNLYAPGNGSAPTFAGARPARSQPAGSTRSKSTAAGATSAAAAARPKVRKAEQTE